MLNNGTKIEVLSGHYAGLKGEIVDQGTFTCFGKEFTGYKIKSHALAGTIIVDYNEVKENNSKRTEIFNRFKTSYCLYPVFRAYFFIQKEVVNLEYENLIELVNDLRSLDKYKNLCKQELYRKFLGKLADSFESLQEERTNDSYINVAEIILISNRLMEDE